VVESYTYDVYGQPSILSATYQLLPTSSVTNRFLFTGREYLAELALYDYRHRFYSPSLGRFLQTDPLRLTSGDANLYQYCMNRIPNRRDPQGLWGSDVHYERTRDWIASMPGVGKTIAERIARANDRTDSLTSGTGPYGAGTGDSSRHFDYDRGMGDSRLTHANEDMQRAINQWLQGDRDAALDTLGRGMHSLQDFYAHRDWDPSVPYGPDWRAHPNWYDDAHDPRNRDALENTHNATIAYMEEFIKAIRAALARRASQCPKKL